MARHKWDRGFNGKKKVNSNRGGDSSWCVKCGCVKEYVKGVPTYFIDDTVHDGYAPECDERLVGVAEEDRPDSPVYV